MKKLKEDNKKINAVTLNYDIAILALLKLFDDLFLLSII